MAKSKIQSNDPLLFLHEICKVFIKKLDEIEPRQLDSDLLWTYIQKHKVEAIVNKVNQTHNLGLSDVLKLEIQQLTLNRFIRKMYVLKEILEIQKAHEVQNIFVIPYKGIAIGSMFYKDINLRDFVDVDFAIEEQHIGQSAEIMKSLGYVEEKGESNFQDLKKSRSYHIDYSWLKFDENNNVLCSAEIHWQPTNSALYSPTKFFNLKTSSQITLILSKEIRLFSKVDNLYYLILHHGLVDNWFQLRHLVDLYLSLQTFNSDDILVLEKKLKEKKALYAYYYGVQLCKDLLDADFENIKVPQLLFYKTYHRKVLSGDLEGKWSENKQKLLYYLILRDSHIDRLSAIIQFCKYLVRELKFKMFSNN